MIAYALFALERKCPLWRQSSLVCVCHGVTSLSRQDLGPLLWGQPISKVLLSSLVKVTVQICHPFEGFTSWNIDCHMGNIMVVFGGVSLQGGQAYLPRWQLCPYYRKNISPRRIYMDFRDVNKFLEGSVNSPLVESPPPNLTRKWSQCFCFTLTTKFSI